MVWRIPLSRTTQLTLADGQDVLIGHVIAINVETGGGGIRGEFSGHHARIYGMVASAGLPAIQLGLDGSGHSGQVVEVARDAQVHQLGMYYAISLIGFASTLINDGLITSTAFGISLGGFNHPETTSTLTNSGTIDVVGSAVVRQGNEPIRILNSGTIRSGTYAFDTFMGSGLESITNSGTMIGDVGMGAGDDLYDGRLGRIDGDIFGGAGNDRLYSGVGNNRLLGGADNDTLDGGAGADRMEGGLGNDTFVVDNAADKVFEAAGQGTDTVLTSVSYALAAGQHVEGFATTSLAGTGTIHLTGNELTQRISGNNGVNSINGGGGNDTILGNGGNDWLAGGTGNDVLTGGAGLDNFVFNTALSPTTNVDRITDFNVAQDTIRLDNAVMAALGTTLGTLAAAKFWKSAAGTAHDADDRIIYETDTGKLFYDANGSAAGGAVHIATLTANLALTNADFVVI